MIIQCEKCQTRFRLDDSRVTDKGVKVRCTRCKHVFTVRKEVPEGVSLPSAVALAELSPPAAVGEPPTEPREEWSSTADVVPAPAADPIVFGETPPESEAIDFTSLESSPFDVSGISFDTEEHELTGAESGHSSAPVSTAAGGGSEFDFSDDELNGSVVKTAQETEPGDFFFDFEDTGFVEEKDMSKQDSSSTSGNQPSFETPADAPFKGGEIDFGDELTSVSVPQVSQNDLKLSQEIQSVPLDETSASAEGGKTEEDMFLGEAASKGQQEPPPLSISSRRKQSPLFGMLIAAAALLAIVVLGYFGYTSLSTPKETALPESGKISVRAVTSAFVANTAAGELLVVSGEAFNEYAKPRAALQVMVTVFDATGQIVATKNAYGGNPLTKEQLENLPLDKIEAAMANPFGDSLTNMGVAPGKSIPFVVVLAHIPAGAKDFSVKSAGSTVATGSK
ncbi:MAG TPA: DUF3426 domain-containing protein [Desulfuromonadales bacterium]|nr:DUF3426 domain-containing protein [Desulfuromonadales bacterium]